MPYILLPSFPITPSSKVLIEDEWTILWKGNESGLQLFIFILLALRPVPHVPEP
jgi:hypothetical protein